MLSWQPVTEACAQPRDKSPPNGQIPASHWAQASLLLNQPTDRQTEGETGACTQGHSRQVRFRRGSHSQLKSAPRTRTEGPQLDPRQLDNQREKLRAGRHAGQPLPTSYVSTCPKLISNGTPPSPERRGAPPHLRVSKPTFPGKRSWEGPARTVQDALLPSSEQGSANPTPDVPLLFAGPGCYWD